jgi:hypothetical protein
VIAHQDFVASVADLMRVKGQEPPIAGYTDEDAFDWVVRENGFSGWVSLEMEGKEPPETAVPKSLDLLRRAFAASGA